MYISWREQRGIERKRNYQVVGEILRQSALGRDLDNLGSVCRMNIGGQPWNTVDFAVTFWYGACLGASGCSISWWGPCVSILPHLSPIADLWRKGVWDTRAQSQDTAWITQLADTTTERLETIPQRTKYVFLDRGSAGLGSWPTMARCRLNLYLKGQRESCSLHKSQEVDSGRESKEASRRRGIMPTKYSFQEYIL